MAVKRHGMVGAVGGILGDSVEEERGERHVGSDGGVCDEMYG